jgi:metal-responsive CopG/Arc/MetJ family transcriptional regulator
VERNKSKRMKRITLCLPQPLYDMLVQHSKQTGLKRSEIIRQALYEYLRSREGVVSR